MSFLHHLIGIDYPRLPATHQILVIGGIGSQEPLEEQPIFKSPHPSPGPMDHVHVSRGTQPQSSSGFSGGGRSFQTITIRHSTRIEIIMNNIENPRTSLLKSEDELQHMGCNADRMGITGDGLQCRDEIPEERESLLRLRPQENPGQPHGGVQKLADHDQAEYALTHETDYSCSSALRTSAMLAGLRAGGIGCGREVSSVTSLRTSI